MCIAFTKIAIELREEDTEADGPLRRLYSEEEDTR
jgi:hypothetical protein